MSIKQKLLVFIVIILATTSCSQHKKSDKIINDWLNGWINESIEMRKIYHAKINSIQVVEIKSDKDFFDINLMKKRKISFEQLLEVELWKIDKSIEIDKKWYNKIDTLFVGILKTEQISFLKNKFNEGINEAYTFRQLTYNYLNDQLSFTNFLLERNCKLIESDEFMYNNLTSKVVVSVRLYNNANSDIYNNKLRRVKEFNMHFNNKNLDKLIDIVNDGVIK